MGAWYLGAWCVGVGHTTGGTLCVSVALWLPVHSGWTPCASRLGTNLYSTCELFDAGYGSGILRFKGMHFEKKESSRCGVELDDAVGNNDGTVGGHWCVRACVRACVWLRMSNISSLVLSHCSANLAVAPLNTCAWKHYSCAD
jgi:hypothetical protein